VALRFFEGPSGSSDCLVSLPCFGRHALGEIVVVGVLVVRYTDRVGVLAVAL
jgi:hypothetical protein